MDTLDIPAAAFISQELGPVHSKALHVYGMHPLRYIPQGIITLTLLYTSHMGGSALQRRALATHNHPDCC